MCQEYVRQLSLKFNPAGLASVYHPAQIIIIACGQWTLIKKYAEDTDCLFPIYANFDRSLYKGFGMGNAISMGPRRDWQAAPTTQIVRNSFFQAVGRITDIFQSGNYMQVGGEVIYQNGIVVFCHRMLSTRDHTEIENVGELIGA